VRRSPITGLKARAPRAGAAAALAASLLVALAIGAPAGAAARTSLGASPAQERAGAQAIEEVMNMHITKAQGKVVLASGSSTGSVAGPVTWRLVLSSGSQATATFVGHNAKGTMEGSASASYRVAGPISYYSGEVTKLSGTGSYAHARSLGIRFSGAVNRKTYQVKIKLAGRWHA
jgi:hypothetical protein